MVVGSRSPWAVAADLIDPPERPDLWIPLPHQVPPEGDHWNTWIIWGGRGIGKTDGCATYMDAHVNGPPCDPRIPGGHRPSIIAPTLGDAVDSCVNGPSGLKAHNPTVKLVQRSGGTYVIWPNGVEGKLFGAYTPNDVERLRAGGNRCIVWTEEIAAWRYLKTAWQHMRYGLRVGPHPISIGSTTPKPRKPLIALLEHPKTVTTRAKTEDNPHLAQDVRDELYRDYGGTRLGRQELDGELLTDTPGALATLDEMDLGRVPEAPDLDKRVLAVDPSITKSLTSDEVGISVSGRVGNEVYQLADLSRRAGVDEWARLVVSAAIEWRCGLILYEANQGSDAIGVVIKNAMVSLGYSEHKIPIEPVTASLSKWDRALPLQQAIQQGRYHIVGSMPELEDQLTGWVPNAESDHEKDDADNKDATPKSPDRMDAAVHGFRKLMGLSGGKGKTTGRQVSNARI